jgi:serine/threonine protein kinase
MPDDLDALRQMAGGVQHIHSKNLVHRDINPTNILIGRPAGAVQVQLKISGFGFCEDIEKDGTFLASQIMGTANYLASELLQQFDSDRFIEGRFSDAIDIFSLGCTFYQFLTKGTHPFGSGFNIPSNIMSGNWDLSSKKILHNHLTVKLTIIFSIVSITGRSLGFRFNSENDSSKSKSTTTH